MKFVEISNISKAQISVINIDRIICLDYASNKIKLDGNIECNFIGHDELDRLKAILLNIRREDIFVRNN